MRVEFDHHTMRLKQCLHVLSDDSSGGPSPTQIIKAGNLVALYPGTFYTPDEPLFWTSIGNPFIFRCADGMLLDGNYSGKISVRLGIWCLCIRNDGRVHDS